MSDMPHLKGNKDEKRPGVFADYGGAFLLLCVLGSLILVFQVLRPFFTVFVLAAFLAVLAQPVKDRLDKWTRKREALSVALTITALVLFVIIPLVLLFSLLAAESYQAYSWINQKVQSGVLERVHGGFIGQRILEPVLAWLSEHFPRLDVDAVKNMLSAESISRRLAGAAGSITNMVIAFAGSAVSAVTAALWQLVLLLFALFYFLKDGKKILSWGFHLLPLPASLESEIVKCFSDVSRSAFFGSFLTSLIQGLLGGIGFLIAGLPPLVWGVVMAFFSMIPLAGTAVIWLPASILLMLTGRTGHGVFLLAWGVVVISASDNFLRPFLMRGRTALSPVLMFFAILGGLASFGLLGVLIGPLSMVILIAFLRAYEEAAKPVLDELDKR